MRREAWLALLTLVTFVVGGCGGTSAIIPAAAVAVKGATKASEASRPITESEEYYVGRAVAAQILGRYKLDQNQKLTEYVNEVGNTVARKSARPNPFKGYHFAVLDTEELNAFACPGGIIFVTRGLIKTCQNEDQLAAVLAHEVGHVVDKDGINSISQARWTQVFTAMGTEAARQYGGVAGNLVGLFEGSIDDVFKTIVVNGYSRQAEENADAAALTELTKAGYDPNAMVILLTTMEAKGKGASSGIFKTHPPTSERLAKVKASVGPNPAEAKGEKLRTERFKKMVS
jgi:beta-barrel assembly-enhancing protease